MISVLIQKSESHTETFFWTTGSSRHCRIFVNSLTHEGESACYLAAKHGHVAVVQLLLTARADFNHLTNDSSCPLYAGIILHIVKFGGIGLCQIYISALRLFPNSGWRWIQGHCGAAGQTWCRGERDTHCFLLDLPSSSGLWSNDSNHKSSLDIWK